MNGRPLIETNATAYSATASVASEKKSFIASTRRVADGDGRRRHRLQQRVHSLQEQSWISMRGASFAKLPTSLHIILIMRESFQ